MMIFIIDFFGGEKSTGEEYFDDFYHGREVSNNLLTRFQVMSESQSLVASPELDFNQGRNNGRSQDWNSL